VDVRGEKLAGGAREKLAGTIGGEYSSLILSFIVFVL
jgi:hypothetical protein